MQPFWKYGVWKAIARGCTEIVIKLVNVYRFISFDSAKSDFRSPNEGEEANLGAHFGVVGKPTPYFLISVH